MTRLASKIKALESHVAKLENVILWESASLDYWVAKSGYTKSGKAVYKLWRNNHKRNLSTLIGTYSIDDNWLKFFLPCIERQNNE